MKKAFSLRLEQEIIDKINKIAKTNKWSQSIVVEEALKNYTKKTKRVKKVKRVKIKKINNNSEWTNGIITLGEEYKQYKVKMKEQFEIEDMYSAHINILAIIADEDINIYEFDIKKGDVIYDSEDNKLNDINNTVLIYQYIPDDDEEE